MEIVYLPKFVKGTWVFCEFKLQQVKETTENRITAVTDGSYEMGGHDLSESCFPLTLTIKRISDEFLCHSNKIHEIAFNSMNFPDFNKYLIENWIECCNKSEDEEKVGQIFLKINNFVSCLKRKTDDLRMIELDGVRIFRRK